MNMRSFLILVLGVGLAGCATNEKAHLASITLLETRLAGCQTQAAAFEKEKVDIQDEVEMYRRAQNVDRDQLLAAQEAFVAAFKGEVGEERFWVSVIARGLDVSISAEKLFVSGSDILSPEGKSLLDRIAPLIDATLPGHYVTIEGHTDNQPLAVFEWKSDWEFSFARALSVLKYFTEISKMDSLRFSAAGFGRYRPRSANDTKEGRRLNRRVELIISPQRGREPVPASIVKTAEPAVEEQVVKEPVLEEEI